MATQLMKVAASLGAANSTKSGPGRETVDEK